MRWAVLRNDESSCKTIRLLVVEDSIALPVRSSLYRHAFKIFQTLHVHVCTTHAPKTTHWLSFYSTVETRSSEKLYIDLDLHVHVDLRVHVVSTTIIVDLMGSYVDLLVF